MRTFWAAGMVVSSVVAFLLMALPVQAASSTVFPSYVDMTAKPGSVRDLGELDLFAPLHQEPGSLFFFNLRGQRDNQNSSEVNAGFGYRHLFGDHFIIGGYGYFDARFTRHNNRFYQATFGAEVLTEHLDARANVYIPVTRQASTPVANKQVIAGPGSVQVRYENRESSLYGFDGELGVGLPWFLPFDKGENDLRLYAGGYHFFRSGVKSVTGPRARMELRLGELDQWTGFMPSGSRLTLGGEIQRDKPRGRQVFGLVRLRIPLQNRGGQKITGLRARLVDPVIRDVDIVTGALTVTEPALFADTGQKVSGVHMAGTAVELFDTTTKGSANSIVVLSKDITTSLTNIAQPGQWIVGGESTRVALKTASGVAVAYVPLVSAAKNLVHTLPGAQAIMPPLSGKSRIENLNIITTQPDGTRIEKAPYLTERFVFQAGEDGKVSGRFSAQSPDGSPLTYQLICEDDLCNILAIDPKTGVISTMPDAVLDESLFATVTVTDAKGRSVPGGIMILSADSLERSQAVIQPGGALPNNERHRGILLRYGNNYKCAGDSDNFGGACDQDGESKISYVKKIIQALLEHDRVNNNDGIAKALESNVAEMVLFNDPDALEASEAYLSTVMNAQDLQASEVFVNAENNNGRNTNSDERNAALEELVHLIHNYGISYARPDLQLELDRLTASALEAGLLKFPDENGDGIDDDGDLPRSDLDDEYLAMSVEAYFNTRASGSTITPQSVCSMGGIGLGAENICAGGRTSRDDLREGHPGMFALIEEVFGSRETLFP